mmetsp:Transcript_75566/g.234448  ORF Transcript_75566/g.234448 Transcript_75566/m.234448 type:complete len:215 (+) Transcript_75566:195-839(+)
MHLPVTLPKEKVEELMQDAEAKKKLTIDLPAQSVLRESGEAISFEVDTFRKHCLVNGLDDIGITLQKSDTIAKFEAKRSERFAWLATTGGSSGAAEVRVSVSKGSSFYARTARGFLAGLPATEDRPARPPASQVVLSATGAAIERAARAAQELQASGDATISKVKTDLIKAPGGDNMPQLVVTMTAKRQAQAVVAATTASGGEGCGCGTKETEW